MVVADVIALLAADGFENGADFFRNLNVGFGRDAIQNFFNMGFHFGARLRFFLAIGAERANQALRHESVHRGGDISGVHSHVDKALNRPSGVVCMQGR